MKTLFKRPISMRNKIHHYCPGCGHGVIHRITAEVLDELNLREKTIGIAPVGCAVYAYFYFNFDMIEVAHGRAPAVASAIKRVQPDKFVISYQGDGDLASIGLAETVHAANRGENLSFIFVNNAVYGMTGGQMAPTTVPGQKTQTTKSGRNTAVSGFPLGMCELLTSVKGVAYLERTKITDSVNILKTKKAIKKAFNYQLEGRGFSMVEVLSPCPVNWNMAPVDAVKWINDEMIKHFPPGVYKDTGVSR